MQASNEEDETGQFADTAEHMHLGPQHYTRDEEQERNVKASNVALEKAKLPQLKGWQVDADNGEDTASKLITCAMGLGGRVIVGAGTNKSLWVWRYDE